MKSICQRHSDTHTVDMAKNCTSSGIELQLDGDIALPVDARPLERVDVKCVAAAAARAEEAFECAWKLIRG